MTLDEIRTEIYYDCLYCARVAAQFGSDTTSGKLSELATSARAGTPIDVLRAGIKSALLETTSQHIRTWLSRLIKLCNTGIDTSASSVYTIKVQTNADPGQTVYTLSDFFSRLCDGWVGGKILSIKRED